MFEPNVIVLYVNDVVTSSQFYQDLLGLKPIQASPTFHTFTLANGMSLALKAKQTVVPPVEEKGGGGELAFTVDNNQQVDELFTTWQAKEIPIIFPPTQIPFGYTFVALDPDGQRLRVVSVSKE